MLSEIQKADLKKQIDNFLFNLRKGQLAYIEWLEERLPEGITKKDLDRFKKNCYENIAILLKIKKVL